MAAKAVGKRFKISKLQQQMMMAGARSLVGAWCKYCGVGPFVKAYGV